MEPDTFRRSPAHAAKALLNAGGIVRYAVAHRTVRFNVNYFTTFVWDWAGHGTVAVGLPALEVLAVEESTVPAAAPEGSAPQFKGNGRASDALVTATRKNGRRCARHTNRDVSLEATYSCPVLVVCPIFTDVNLVVIITLYRFTGNILLYSGLIV